MRARVYARLSDARAALDAIDGAAGLPRTHEEGRGRDDFQISYPGNAAARLRSAGIRTERSVELRTHPRGHAFAVALDSSDAEDLDDTWFEPAPR